MAGVVEEVAVLGGEDRVDHHLAALWSSVTFCRSCSPCRLAMALSAVQLAATSAPQMNDVCAWIRSGGSSTCATT